MNGQMGKENVIDTYNIYTYSGTLFSIKKQGNSAVCNNMEEPWGHHAVWDPPDTERPVLHGPTPMSCLK